MRSAPLAVTVALVCAASIANAAPEPPVRPWAAGISAADQARATEQFERGNELLEQGLFVQALDLYRDAIATWDHPAIRYNIAVALINLDRQLDAYRELEHALRFGAAALEPDTYLQALAYQRLLAGQLVRLAIECIDPGTQITLDGVDLAVPCPGSIEQLLLPGRHRVIASRPGSVTRTIELAPAGGESPRERIDLMTIDEATLTHRRWARWKPWAVVGGGTVIGLVGLGFQLQSAATFRSYDRAIATLCPDRPCDAVPGVVSDAYDRARAQNRLAVGLFVIGGATVATGAALLWLNRTIHERIGYDRVPSVNASIHADGATIGAGWAF